MERTRSGGGERTTSAIGASIVVEGDGESNGSLGDGGQEHDGNTGLPRLDVDAASTNTKPGRTIGLSSSKVGRASTLEEVGTEGGQPFIK